MKNYFIPVLCAIFMLSAATIETVEKSTEDAFVLGTPSIKSMSKLAFSPEGVLFLGDS